MASAGRILIMPKGNWSAETEYEMLDLVYHNGTSWLAKTISKGIEPSEANGEYWQHMSELVIADNLTTTSAGKALSAKQGKVLDEKKQERETSNVIVPAKSSYTLTMQYAENCLLFAYIDEMLYAGLFTCCGINEHAYSIIELNKKIKKSAEHPDGSIVSEIGKIGGVDVNKITFSNLTEADIKLRFVKIPFFYRNA